MTDDIFRAIGVILISNEGPSFGTPIFIDNDEKHHFVQSSVNGVFVDEFVPIPFRRNDRDDFVELRSNRSCVVGSPFLFGFRDYQDRVTIDEKFILQLKMIDEIPNYSDRPFLSYAIARFLEDERIALKIIATSEIQRAFRNGEISSPSFLHKPRVEDQSDVAKNTATGDQAPPEAEVWSDERVELLKHLWMAGFNANQIAERFGNLTGKSVIRKVNKLGLADPENQLTTPRYRPQTNRPDLASIREKLASKDEVTLHVQRKSLDELDEGSCRWPLTSPNSSELYFCGDRSLAGLPYCAYHSRIAYKPAVDGRRLLTQTGEREQKGRDEIA